jgi:hypothetical protein
VFLSDASTSFEILHLRCYHLQHRAVLAFSFSVGLYFQLALVAWPAFPKPKFR